MSKTENPVKAESKEQKENNEKSDEIFSIASNRGFFFKTAEIYGGKKGFYTYGHLGKALKNKFEKLWKKYFLSLNDNFYEIQGSNILPKQVFEASGHLENFKGLMFGVNVEKGSEDYLSPETAQSAYLVFKKEFEATRRKLPLGLAIIGNAYRNEISPRQLFFRLREFNQAELQIFIDPEIIEKAEKWNEVKNYKLRVFSENKLKEISCDELNKTKKIPQLYLYYLAKVQKFYLDIIGIKKEKLRLYHVGEDERAFYNKIHFDVEIDMETLGGFKEVTGVHYRTDYDLSRHEKHSKQNLHVNYMNKNLLPHVIELSFGVDRNIWALLDVFYEKDKVESAEGVKEERYRFKFPAVLSPVDVAIFPLVNKEGMPEIAEKIFEELREEFSCFYDDSASIGKRYRRQDEIGTPFCVTVDGESLKKKDVTVRDRDSLKQERVKISELKSYLNNKIHNIK
jgi:glycyl-tRNA synthetase